jgi:prolyl 4-hydroxylase
MSADIRKRGIELLAAGQAQAAVDLMVGGAKSGDAGALYELALWHVYGTPVARDFTIARALFERAGQAGHTEGAATHAVFVAMGAGGPADWPTARTLVEKVAQTDPEAARQANLIAAMDLKSDGTPAALAPPGILSASPHVAVARALLTPDEGKHVARLSQPRLTPSVVVDPRTGRQSPHPIRTSEGTVLGPIQQDLVIHALNLRFAAATATGVRQGEPLSVLRYAPGQQYRLHHDCLPGETNQRVLTLIAYLNDDYAGGATGFPENAIEFQGQAGDALIFANTLPDGRPDERNRHAGLPVTRGEKWVATRWIRARDFDPWGMYRG